MFIVLNRSKLFFYFIIFVSLLAIVFGLVYSLQKKEELHLCTEYARDLKPQNPPMEGDDVEELQIQLKRMGYYHGEIDGIYQGEIVQVVKNIQRELGLTIDGIVNTQFYEAIYLGDTYTETVPKDPPKGELKIVVDLDKRLLTLLNDGKEYATFPITIGKPNSPSPVGDFKIVDKSLMPGNNAFGTRWMRLNTPWGGYGIHGTNNPGAIGHAQSGGCIRLFNKDIEKLYSWVPVGTPVSIYSNRWPPTFRAEYKRGMMGQDVVYVQRALREFGFCHGIGDGRFNEDTENEVKEFQKYLGLPATGIVDENILYLLRLR
ncbi:Lipoprotein-anchoring transpeptidase ErfK/SrfK [Anaerobranca californiensis DSM 14826]|uniref:Lipoprotein-anchoring transpeptidase ErfK/SrfK n=1 Tax=Anaerobranca californiensis DSM 14826 TaxID=1120989 RepID=A0A1M6P504_9FIRM|nr:peptidoglycan-binding protein [Anaerobranca californiensis]SHK03045.1 Lipoprotein-anchoring transpeptidase ErfK/SrfK [Anaerobranca californiensis DSM 14826]